MRPDSVYDLSVLSLEKYSSSLHNSLFSTNILINNDRRSILVQNTDK
ncbi:hypothetical protein DW780_03780 [Bacteroides thetaiotaomicron]|uniref:Uncharacterized protein n=1 Tax=Bacteroides thetaiotaomicron TaxID=818 RepID=A0A414HRX7_BACT4|nr:hypothetical protein DWY97_09990 [Bacteroides thetaiotaomicron]RHD90128.1 hypothetical protein DW780_03780 [Bacteroides thetaiotaomicron]